MDDIAIIGIGCRVPGADNIDEFWRVLVNSENHIVEVPKDRWNNDAFYSDNRDEAGKTYVKKAGFINGHDEWDNKFFGVSDNEAVNVDPQQRFVLECTHMALEDAGITRKQIQGTSTGVYIGAMNEDYKSLTLFEHQDDTNYSATGTSSTIISARVSYVYDLRGPCMVVDTACSSSMIAIHLGSQAIRTGDCDVAICGGVNCMVSPGQFMTLCKAKMLSPTGQCQSFCDTADGYGRGEGCGIVILKSYEKAVRDGNMVWGLIKSGSNQDGHAVQPITAPSGDQQIQLMSKLYSLHAIDPTTLQYIEAHGTGTPVGDPIEINALGRFIESNRSKLSFDKTDNPVGKYTFDKQQNEVNKLSGAQVSETTVLRDEFKTKNTILIGSVKSNIGHLESAAGVVALIKVLLMMEHGKFVPSLHVKKDKSNINRKITLEKYHLDISLEVADWNKDSKGERICCINCFGFGGSNTHAIVVQKGHRFPRLEKADDNLTNSQYKVVCISNMNTTSLKGKLELFSQNINKGNHDLALHDISFTSIFHRDHFTYRTLLFGRTTEDIAKQVKYKVENILEIETAKKIRIIFVFCGVGTTWKGMCREMMSTQIVFRETVNNIDDILSPLVGWSIAQKFHSDTDYSNPFDNQIAIFCTQIALFELWKSWGIQPQAIVGQSVGEVAASFASGSLNLKDAVHVIVIRSKILAKVTSGKMMVVGNMAVDKLESLCRKYNHGLAIAVYSSPVSCTVSGDADAVDQLKADLEDMNENKNTGIMITPLSDQCAYHSHHMDKCSSEIESKLKQIEKGKRMINLFSTVTGKLAEDNDYLTGQYWAKNIRKPVLFMDAILQSTDGNATNVFVELGPRQVLRAHLKNILGKTLKGLSLPSMNARKECEALYASLGKLYELDADINWKGVLPTKGHIVRIPMHVFQKTKILHIPKQKQFILKGIQTRSDSHMFLRQSSDSTANFIVHLDKETAPFVYDHFMYRNVLVPGATYIEAAFEIGHQRTSLNVLEMSVSIEFMQTLMPRNEKQCQADVEVLTNRPNEVQYRVKQNAKRLCQGKIVPRTKYGRTQFNVQRIKDRCKTHRTKEENYECLDKLHFQYGESLRVIEQSWSSDFECVVELEIPDSVLRQRKVTHMHPSVIDGLFQIAGVLGTTGTEGPALPKGVASFLINRPPQRNMFGYSQLVKSNPTGNHYNFFLLCPDGHVLAEVYDFYIKYVKDGSEKEHNLRHCLKWRKLKICEEFGQTPLKSAKSRNLAVYGCERFNSLLKPLTEKAPYFFDIEEMEGDIFKQASSLIAKLDSVIFAPSYHIQNISREGTVLFECIKKSFIHLSRLFDMLRETSANVPVFVVTENVIGLRETTNICGAELWGMVRSAINEGSAKDVKLIDMTFSEENAKALKTVLDTCNHSKGYNEYLIENGILYYCMVIESDENVIPLRRKINLEMTENIVLKTSSPSAILRPFFDMNLSDEQMEATLPEQCQIHLKKICLHESSIFLTSLGREDEQCCTEDETGCPVLCIEGVGKKQCSSKDNVEREELGFCFPVKVSAVVSIPEKCTFNLATLTVYTPGMFTVGVILWKIIDACKQSDKVTCIVDNTSRLWLQLMRTLFYCRTTNSLAFESSDKLSNPVPDRQSEVCNVIVLTQLSDDRLNTMLESFPAVQSVIAIEGFISKKQKMMMKMKNERLALHILETEDMFSPQDLTNIVPEIFNIFTSFKNKSNELQAEEDQKQSKDIFSLPYAVLALENEHGKACIPLMVTRDNVFRTSGCYIVVGGLTGLGWELVQYMASYGAKFIATFSRRCPTPDKENEIQQIMGKCSSKIIPVQVDITDLRHLKNGMEKLHSILDGAATIRGILHGGGVTCDKVLKDMSEEDIEKVLLPKVLGTWNLHVVTQDIPLDFFIMHSSVASVFGNQGQCNYAAGNSFQDSFAHYRQSIGLCGQSINWSALSLGMATESELLEKYLTSQGFYYLTKEEIRECFIESVMTGQSQTMYGKFDWQKLQKNPLVEFNPQKFADILKKHSTFVIKSDMVVNNNDMIEFYRKDPFEQNKMVFELVKSKIVETYVVDENKLTENTEILALGIDSMTAMSFTNVIFDATDVRVPIGTLFDESATVGKVTNLILKGMQNKSDSQHTEIQQSDERIKAYLAGDISFMQKTLLDDFVKDRFSLNIMRQVDFEIKGLEIQKNDLKIIINHLIRNNTDLRRIYRIVKVGEYQPILLDSDNVDIRIEDVDFFSICEANSEDERYKVNMDITKELPIKVMMALRKDTTRVRVYVHAVLGDLYGITNLFNEMAEIIQCHFHQKELPTKDTNVNPTEAVRRAIIPQSKELMQYWKTCFQGKIEPFTLSSEINEELEESYWVDSAPVQLPTKLVEALMGFISTERISLYQFLISTYMILLHEKTGKRFIPLVTYVDMRSHVQQLRSVLQSCSNAIPVIGDLRDMGSFSKYLKRMSLQLNDILQHSAYPYELIQEEMMSEDLKKHIGRHRFIMENFTSLNNDLTQEGYNIRIGNFYYKRHVYETSLHVEYDTQQSRVNLQFGYNGKAIAKSDAKQIRHRMLYLIRTFVKTPHKEVETLLKENERVGLTPTCTNAVQERITASDGKTKEDRTSMDGEVRRSDESTPSYRHSIEPNIPTSR